MRRERWQDDVIDTISKDLAARQKYAKGIVEDTDMEFLESFGFYYSFDYLRRTVYRVERYKILPRDGGWDDQDPAFLADMDTYKRLEYILEHSAGFSDPVSDEDFDG